MVSTVLEEELSHSKIVQDPMSTGKVFNESGASQKSQLSSETALPREPEHENDNQEYTQAHSKLMAVGEQAAAGDQSPTESEIDQMTATELRQYLRARGFDCILHPSLVPEPADSSIRLFPTEW